MSSKLKLNGGVAQLDSGYSAKNIINFKGPMCLDFGCTLPEFDVANDEELLAAMMLPLRESCKINRISRSTGSTFSEYVHPKRLDLVRAIVAAMGFLCTHDVLDEATTTLLTDAAADHDMLRKLFYEAHNDWDSAIMQLRLLLEPCAKMGGKCELVTYKDDGSGSTAKGTTRAMMDVMLGVYNGAEKRGYSCVLGVEILAVKTKEAPSELKTNMQGCCHSWFDDFKPEHPLALSEARSLTGQNTLTAARKNKGNDVFNYDGATNIVVNKGWTPDAPVIGADKRRFTGLNMEVTC